MVRDFDLFDVDLKVIAVRAVNRLLRARVSFQLQEEGRVRRIEPRFRIQDPQRLVLLRFGIAALY